MYPVLENSKVWDRGGTGEERKVSFYNPCVAIFQVFSSLVLIGPRD